MRVTRWGEYGVLCSLVLARRAHEGKPLTSAADIAEGNAIAVDYVQQIMQRLKRGGIVVSERGPHGGYLLARQAEQITLRDILFAAEGDTFAIMCDTAPLSTERCGPNTDCGLRGIWREFHDHIDSFLSRYTLADIMQKFEPEDVLVQLGSVTHQEPELL